MRKLILTCALMTLVSALSYGQDANTQQAPARNASAQRGQMPAPEKVAQMRANRYKQQLGLNEEQYKGVYDAELKYVQDDQAFRSRQNGNPPAPGPAQQMMIVHDRQFKSVLTAEQYAKYEKMRTPMPGAPMPPAAGAAPATH